MSDTKGRTIEERIDAVLKPWAGGARHEIEASIKREFADVVETDPQVVTLIKAALAIVEVYGCECIEDGDLGLSVTEHCPMCLMRAALRKLQK